MPNNVYRSQAGRLGFKNAAAAWNTTLNAPFTLSSDDGLTVYYLWVDSSARLRIKLTAPTSDTDGTVVGAQA